MARVVVYVPVRDAEVLVAEGKDPAVWVRMLVRRALERKREGSGG